VGGAAIAPIPRLPVLLLYLPARVAATRERREIEDALHRCDPEELDQLLALRAAAGQPLCWLRRHGGTPARDVREGEHRALADAELRRFGLERPRAPTRARDHR
jgi:hypothetical protein